MDQALYQRAYKQPSQMEQRALTLYVFVPDVHTMAPADVIKQLRNFKASPDDVFAQIHQSHHLKNRNAAQALQ